MEEICSEIQAKLRAPSENVCKEGMSSVALCERVSANEYVEQGQSYRSDFVYSITFVFKR